MVRGAARSYDLSSTWEVCVTGPHPDTPARDSGDQSVFLNEWQTYRKVLDNNYMFHREVYGLLRRVLMTECVRPFRFLDIGCGDASAAARALRGTPIAHYYGIDLSESALKIARDALAPLGCPLTLENDDFFAALARWATPVDVAWTGQSLHHLLGAEKVSFMGSVRRVLSEPGLLLIWEPTTLEGEDRDGWIARFESGSRPLWSSLTDQEWSAMLSHIRAADYPETAATWMRMGREAGFSDARELFVAPTKLARVYCFSK
jgi:SAM-dependent methyltransferase